MATCLICNTDWGQGPACQVCTGEYASYDGAEYLQLHIITGPNGNVITSLLKTGPGKLYESLCVRFPPKAEELRNKLIRHLSAKKAKEAREQAAHYKSILAVTQALLDKRELELIDESNSDVKGVTAEPSNE